MKLFNYKEKEHSFQDFLNIISPEDKERVEKSIKDALENKTSIDIEYKLIYQDGSEKYLWDRARISYNEEGKPVRSIGTVADISKLKKIERDLKSVKNNLRSTNAELEVRVEERTKKLSVVNEELNRMNNELDKYAYIISHDLKAPLNSIDGLIAMVKDDYNGKILEKDGLDMLEMMNTKVQDMRQLIDESLLSAKAIKTVKEPINLYHLTQEVIDTLNPPPHFHIFIQHTLPVVLYNRSSLIRVLQNLLGNAIKYMNNEHPLIKVACIEHNNYFQLCVSDNGPGIPKEKLKKIFEIFEVAHSNNKIESHGLGLSIVKQLAEENGGRAWVESAEGEETHFYFTIPKK
jgi:PAS domain S-box-containing protein